MGLINFELVFKKLLKTIVLSFFVIITARFFSNSFLKGKGFVYFIVCFVELIASGLSAEIKPLIISSRSPLSISSNLYNVRFILWSNSPLWKIIGSYSFRSISRTNLNFLWEAIALDWFFMCKSSTWSSEPPLLSLYYSCWVFQNLTTIPIGRW